ncbi:hypothetical protein AA0111_g2876 [Alternaria arborescens]|nr:hypothetical protein AA0111_g2876 [Alternaria arborescens]RYO36170.1 hypothetical protein AA0111_g2876 [Alternaria arborescens]
MDDSTEIAFEARETFNENNKISAREIVLKSKELKRLIWTIIGEWLRHEKRISPNDWESEDQTWTASFIFATHYWTEFEAEVAKNIDDQPHRDLKDLLEYIELVQPDLVRIRRQLQTLDRIPYRYLWMLFRPGSLIVAKPSADPSHIQVLQVHSHRPSSRLDRQGEMAVVAWAFDWNGTKLVKTYYEFPLGGKDQLDIENQVRIVDLDCLPIRYYRSDDSLSEGDLVSLRSQLKERGQTLRECCVHKRGKDKMCSFDGTIEIREDQDRNVTGRKIDNKPAVVDFEAYRENCGFSPRLGRFRMYGSDMCHCGFCVGKPRSDWMDTFKNPAINFDDLAKIPDSEDNWLLLPYRVLGYLIEDHLWAQLPVKWIKQFEHEEENAYDTKIMFPEEKAHQKRALEKLILSRTGQDDNAKQDKYWVSDFVKGKGKGLVILLHGATGLGKTSTAETLAKTARRPLLKVSASGIGTSPKAAEDNLMKYFRLASNWEAILLLDEADVFLETRGTPGEKVFERNALVSVMLRILEYFDGILVLTTNRVLKLDIAMLSRIHYAVHFTNLSKKQEELIWKQQLKQLDPETGNCESEEKKKIDDWAHEYLEKQRGTSYNQRIRLNGREIQNVFKTAQRLASGDKRNIKCQDLKEAIEATSNFRADMRDRVMEAEKKLVVKVDEPES